MSDKPTSAAESIFMAALEIETAEERSAYVNESCGDDARLHGMARGERPDRQRHDQNHSRQNRDLRFAPPNRGGDQAELLGIRRSDRQEYGVTPVDVNDLHEPPGRFRWLFL